MGPCTVQCWPSTPDCFCAINRVQTQRSTCFVLLTLILWRDFSSSKLWIHTVVPDLLYVTFQPSSHRHSALKLANARSSGMATLPPDMAGYRDTHRGTGVGETRWVAYYSSIGRGRDSRERQAKDKKSGRDGQWRSVQRRESQPAVNENNFSNYLSLSRGPIVDSSCSAGRLICVCVCVCACVCVCVCVCHL